MRVPEDEAVPEEITSFARAWMARRLKIDAEELRLIVATEEAGYAGPAGIYEVVLQAPGNAQLTVLQIWRNDVGELQAGIYT